MPQQYSRLNWSIVICVKFYNVYFRIKVNYRRRTPCSLKYFCWILVLLLSQPHLTLHGAYLPAKEASNHTFLPVFQTYPTLLKNWVNSRQNFGRLFLRLLHSGILGEEDTSRTSEIPAILLPITYQTHFPEGVYHCVLEEIPVLLETAPALLPGPTTPVLPGLITQEPTSTPLCPRTGRAAPCWHFLG